ncbi:MAG: toll/interleukin-1 receptor domain-containing protein [Deltaproteobacteria bacterium]|nr:toll/interleukin-1 receptor domain-containing protein [Deltaproteobacteria bacterium]
MASRNLYPHGRSMRDLRERTASTAQPCIFISHRSVDKRIAVAVAAAFDQAGLDYYLDTADHGLQAAAADGNADAIVKAIEEGIRKSTHLLGIVTTSTQGSWWVPFEIGSSRAVAASAGVSDPGRRTAYLVDPDVTDLPAYMKVSSVLTVQSELAAWIAGLLPRTVSLDESRIRTASAGAARLQSVLPSTRYPIRYR